MVQVKVNEGILEGEVVKNDFGGQFCSFRGIPYAEPPVGNLRFKAPVAIKPWDGIRSAKECGSVCYQFDPTLPGAFGSEDCLFLNVYTPTLNPKKPLPVMIWIHGGAFKFGSGNDDLYDPEFLVRHDVILVTINYRLEALGFLCLDTKEIPGNAGMKDQVAAMRWVKSNIKNFGGDPENITIFGESAGGASVSYHLVSPMTKGLFKRAIVQSGTLTCWWAQTFEPRERALKLAQQLGFYSDDDKELEEFFINVPVDKLVNLNLPVAQSTKLYELSIAISNEKKFGDDERFFYGDQVEILKNGIHKDVEVMTGFTADEGIMALGLGLSLEALISHANSFTEFYAPKPIQLATSLKNQIEAGRRIKEFYFKKRIISKADRHQIFKFLDWDMFLHGGLLFAKIISKQTKVYVYKFTCQTERNVLIHLFGLGEVLEGKKVVSHADDLTYLFPSKKFGLTVDKNSDSYSVINRVTTLWTNFAKFGNPTPDNSLGVKWSPYTPEEKAYLDVGNLLEAGTALEGEIDEFWDSIFTQYLPSYTA